MSTDQVTARGVSDRAPDVGVPLVEGTVSKLLTDQARRIPDRTALVATTHAGEHRRWTYSELLNAARHMSGSLLTVADPGDHVAIWAPNVAEWPIVQYAAALAGMTLVALDPSLAPAELRNRLALSRATVLIHADSAGTCDMAGVVAAVAPELPDLLDVISMSEVGMLYGSPVVPEELSAPAAPAMMQFTAGTAKAVLLAHRALVDNARLTLLTAGVPQGATLVAALPAFHPAGCGTSHLGAAALGATVVLPSTPDPAAVLAAIADEGASVLVIGSAELRAVLDAGAAVLDTVLVVPADGTAGVEEAFGATVHQVYWQTEHSPVLGLAGRPLPHTACRIIGPAGEVVPLGVQGEICVRGPGQMIEYFDDPAATAASVDSDGWLHTGDLGTMDERGAITLSGRLAGA